MGKSLFLTQDTVTIFQRSFDNFLIAKILYDAGTPLPPDTVFKAEDAYDAEGTVFLKAVASIFGSKVCPLDGGLEGLNFTIRIPLVEEWAELTSDFSNSDMVMEDQDYFMAPIIEEYSEDEFYDQSMFCELLTYGVVVKIESNYGSFHPFVRSFFDFKERLQEKVEQYRKGREKCGRNTHHSKKRRELRQSSKAS